MLLAPNTNVMIEKRQNSARIGCQKCKWTSDETELLIRLNRDFNGNAHRICEYFPKRTYNSVEKKLMKISKIELKKKVNK